MYDPEIQFRALGPIRLADALREALGEEGRKPSRKRVVEWIRAGRVRVEGAVVEDPARELEAGATIDLGPGDVAAAPARSAARRPEGILHLDRHLLVVAYEPPVVVGPGGSVEARLARALEDAAVDGLRPRPVPVPDARASGLVVGALSAAGEAELGRAFASGAAALTVVADVVDEGGAARRIRHDAVASVPGLLADLERRGVAVRGVPGAGPARQRPLLVHVLGIRLPHPRTGRTLAWELPLPPTFGPDPR